MKEVKINHIALQFKSKEKADIFFCEILGISKSREFELTCSLSEKIFDISEDVKVCVYENEKCKFEVFITDKKNDLSFNHICLEISDRKELIEKCRKNGLEVRLVDKNDKTLLFIKDFSENIYEVKS